MTKKCPICSKGKLKEVEDIVSEIEGYVFIEKGERCNKCSEEFIREREAQKTIEISKRLGIWPKPLKLHRSLSKSGRGLILRIPSDLEKDMKLKPGSHIAISKIGHKIIIEPE